MKTYQVIGRVACVHAGLVKIDDAQAQSRRHLLKPRGEGVYEILKPIQFKSGERFGYDGEFPKSLAVSVATPEMIETMAESKRAVSKKVRKKSDTGAASEA